MAFIPKPHEIYKHFKGNLYQIVTIAEHSETGELLVIYQALYGEFKTYARPLSMFTGEVDHTKYPDVTQKYRFELQGADIAERNGEREAGETESLHKSTEGASNETEGLDPMILQFLEADSYEEKLNILVGLHHRMTEEMITTLAVASDVELPEGDLEEKYNSLRYCLRTLDKYECNRLR